ncbi:hypothetical protein BC828DRAFT_376123 [Blastocladiella britannica]|nr:hypothetical protein BC828DRAFT_376123 [Blastocladiella britannica]
MRATWPRSTGGGHGTSNTGFHSSTPRPSILPWLGTIRWTALPSATGGATVRFTTVLFSMSCSQSATVPSCLMRRCRTRTHSSCVRLISRILRPWANIATSSCSSFGRRWWMLDCFRPCQYLVTTMTTMVTRCGTAGSSTSKSSSGGCSDINWMDCRFRR